MPDFDQLLRVLHREEPKYVPFYEHLADVEIMEAILGFKKPPYKEGFENKQKIMKFYADFYNKCGFDVLPFESGLNLFKIGGFSSGGRGWVDHSASTINNLEEFDEYPWPEIEQVFDFELIEAAGKILPEGMRLIAGVAGGVQEHVLSLVGLKRLSIAVRKEPKFISKMFEKIGFLIREVDKIIAEKDYVCALRMGDDMGYKSSTLLNPKTVREHVLPEHKKIVEVAHKKGKPFILHSCGNLSEIIDQIIEDVKIDGWHSFQDLILPVTKAKEQFGNQVALLGGIDLDTLCRSDQHQLELYCKNVLEVCKKGGGYAFGTGNSVANYVPLENFKMMLEFGKKYGKYE